MAPETDDTARLPFVELRRALEDDDVVRIESALADGLSPALWLDLDSRDSLLAVAILAGSPGCAELLLKSGGDWTDSAPPQEDQISPLALAVQQGLPEMVGIFVRLGAVERYALGWLEDIAAELLLRPCDDEAALEVLERVIARPEGLRQTIPQPSVRTGLEKKARSCSQKCADPALAERWAEIGRAFQASGVDVKDLLDQVETLASRGHASRLRRVLDELPPEARGEGLGRALVYAAGHEDGTLAEELLEIGADCSVRVGGETALMDAARSGNLSLVRKLIAAGADPAARQDRPGGKTAAEMAGSRLVELYLRKQMAKGSG